MKLIRALLLPALLMLAWAGGSGEVAAQTIVHTSCGALSTVFPAAARGVPFSIDENGNTCINGAITASLAGFTPNGNYAALTSAGTSGSVGLPAGATVLFQNTGTTQVSCTLGVGSATAVVNEIQVPASSTVPVVVGSNTFGACIDQSGSTSNTVVLAGGSGLGNGFGGGGGGAGGSSAITTWAGGILGAMANYGTSPGAVLVPSVNAFITNTLTLPTGASTSALQTTINTTLGTPMQQTGGSVTANIGTAGTLSTAANQTSQITQETAIAGAAGTTADAPCTLPATTTACSQVAVQKAIANAANSAVPLGSASGGWTPLLVDALSTTVKGVKASAAGQLGELFCWNPNATVAYVQVFDIATTGAVTLGTTVPKQSFGIPPTNSGGYTLSLVGLQFASGIQLAATTTAKGLTALGTAVDCSVAFN